MGLGSLICLQRRPGAAYIQAMLRLILLITCLIATPLAAKPSFVFVHGAFVGGWYWTPLRTPLEQAGFQTYAVDLTGFGGKADRSSPNITLEDHVTDIVSLIDAEGLNDVILVAHSYGGRPATGAWDRRRDHIRHLVYIEAVAPYAPGPHVIPAARNALAQLMIRRPDIADTGMIPVSDALADKYPDQILAHQPISTVYGPLDLIGNPLPPTPATYVLGKFSNAPIFKEYAARTSRLRGWDILHLQAGHDVVRDAPAAVLDLLLEIANRP